MSSNTGPYERSFTCWINWINYKFILYVIPPDFSIFSWLNSLEDRFSEYVGFIREKFFLKNIFNSNFVFLQLCDDYFDIFTKNIRIMSKSQLFFSFGHLLFLPDWWHFLSSIFPNKSSLILFPNILKLIFFQFINSINFLNIFMQIKISMTIMISRKIFINLFNMCCKFHIFLRLL